MVISTPTCERCGGESACTRQEVHVLHGHICGPCRTQEELKALATEAYLNAEYEVKRLIANRQGLRPDGTPGPKLAQAMYAAGLSLGSAHRRTGDTGAGNGGRAQAETPGAAACVQAVVEAAEDGGDTSSPPSSVNGESTNDGNSYWKLR